LAAIDKRDARQLVKAGLTGGKGIPETVAAHPCVFATFTAPSFGPVHARRMRGQTVLPCRPRRDAKMRVCPHGRDSSSYVQGEGTGLNWSARQWTNQNDICGDGSNGNYYNHHQDNGGQIMYFYDLRNTD